MLDSAGVEEAIGKELDAVRKALGGRIGEVRKRYLDELHREVDGLKAIPQAMYDALASIERRLGDVERRLSARESALPAVPARPQSVAEILGAAGIDVVDKRGKKGGNLWVAGQPSLVVPELDRLRARGINFEFSGSSRALKGGPGWFSTTRE